MKLIYLLLLLVFGSGCVFADCITGYACPVKELQIREKKQKELFSAETEKYFKQKINEDFMLGNTNDVKYKDLFPFSIYLQKGL